MGCLENLTGPYCRQPSYLHVQFLLLYNLLVLDVLAGVSQHFLLCVHLTQRTVHVLQLAPNCGLTMRK